jgi:hypothetical protein
MRGLVATLSGAVALAIGLAAGTAAAGGSSSGTETLTAVASGAAAANQLNSNNNSPLKFPSIVFSGPVHTSITNATLGGSKAKTAAHTFPTPAGNLAVTRTATSNGQAQPSVSGQTGNICHFTQNAGTGIFKVDGSKSTGKFAGATGSGTYTLTIVASADLSAGKTTCSANNTSNALATGTSITFKASGPLTLKK